MLYIQPSHDPLAHVEDAEEYRRALGDRVTVVVIPNSAHAVIVEQPDAVSDALIAYARKLWPCPNSAGIRRCRISPPSLSRLLAWIAPAKAQTQALPTTDILLVLAVDASGSVNQTRFELQRRGYADAFRSQQVLNAIRGGSTGSIAVTMVQWTGPPCRCRWCPGR